MAISSEVLLSSLVKTSGKVGVGCCIVEGLDKREESISVRIYPGKLRPRYFQRTETPRPAGFSMSGILAGAISFSRQGASSHRVSKAELKLRKC